MDKFEKIVFLEMTNKQFTKLPNSEYFETYKCLTEKEKDIIDLEISGEIHDIWSYINSPRRKGINNNEINSISEYIKYVKPINPLIQKISSEFGITLKDEISEKFKKAIIETLGKDYLDNLLDKRK